MKIIEVPIEDEHEDVIDVREEAAQAQATETTLPQNS